MNHRNHQDLLAADRAHIIHPYLPGATEERVIMISGSGCRLTDSEASALVEEILRDKQRHLKELEALAGSQPATTVR